MCLIKSNYVKLFGIQGGGGGGDTGKKPSISHFALGLFCLLSFTHT